MHIGWQWALILPMVPLTVHHELHKVLSHIADGMCIGNILLATDGHGTFLLAYRLIREDTES